MQGIQLKRKDIIEQLHSPFLEEILNGAFVKAVYGSQQYRVCKVTKYLLTDVPYKVQCGTDSGKHREVETKVKLLCQYGKFSKQVRLTQISDKLATTDEFDQLRATYASSGSKFIDKRYCGLKKKQLNQLTSGNLSLEQQGDMLRRKLEQQIRSGKFNQIASIPRTISNLNSELEALQRGLSKAKESVKLQADKKIAKLKWMIHELNQHRETESRPAAAVNSKIEDTVMLELTEEAVQRRKELKEIDAVVSHFQKLSSARFMSNQNNASSTQTDKEKVLNFKHIRLPLLEMMTASKSIGEIAFLDDDADTDEAIRYKQQKYGPVLTSSSAIDATLRRFKSELVYVPEEPTAVVTRVITLDEYFA